MMSGIPLANPKKIILPLLALLASAVFAEIVTEQGESIRYRQSDGRVVELPKQPRQVVVAYASLIPVWQAAGGRAAGIPELREHTPGAENLRELPKIGSGQSPNMEKILALQPDLVILSAKLERHRAAAVLLRQSGVAAVCVEYENYRDFSELLDFFRRLNGTSSAKADADARKIADDIDQLCRRTEKLTGPRTAIIFAAARDFSLESPRTNTGVMAEMLGAKNILSGDGAVRRRFSFERFLLEEPEVVLIVMMGEAAALREKFRREILSQPAWAQLPAARNRRVHFLPVELFLYLPGPRYPEAFRLLAELLYPEEEFDL